MRSTGWTFILALAATLVCAPAKAVPITFLGIDGMLGPGGAGNYPLDADFSWISHRYPGNVDAHIWTLAPGSDGGVTVGSAQTGRGEITAPRAMYNLTSWLYSVGSGVQFDDLTDSFDVSDLRLSWGGTDYDFGFGGGISGLVPLVAGEGAVADANGWWLDGAGYYHLVFRGNGQCEGCELTVHLTGQLTEVPLPAAAWLFGSGLAGLLFGVRRSGQRTCHRSPLPYNSVTLIRRFSYPSRNSMSSDLWNRAELNRTMRF